MDNDYYKSSYHQSGGPPGTMQHSSSSGSYQRSRTMLDGPGGPGSGSSMQQPLSSVYQAGAGSGNSAYNGPPARKPMLDSVGSSGSGLPPPMLRDYQSGFDSGMKNDAYLFDANKKMHGTMSAGSEPYSSRSSYMLDEPPAIHSKYDMHASSGSGGRSVPGGYGRDASEDISVSKMASYGGGGSGMPQSARDTINSYERDLARELEPPMRNERSAPQALGSTLEKYFTSDEIKRFNEYNRFLVMSSPGRQKKFYSSLSSAEYKRFCDFVDFETSSNSSLAKAPLPPIPSKVPAVVPPPPPIPGAYESSNPYSSYSFSSLYDEDKLSGSAPGGRIGGELLSHRFDPLKKYSASSGSPPDAIAAFLKSRDPYYSEKFTERSSRDISRYADFERSHRSRSPTMEALLRASYRSTRSRSRSPRHHSSSSSSRRHSSRSPGRDGHAVYIPHRDFRDVGSSSSRDRERDRDRDRERERDRDRGHSHSHSRSGRSRSRSPRDSRDYKRERDRDYHSHSSRDRGTSNLGGGGGIGQRKLSPEEEHKYLTDSLIKVKKIYKMKLEELEEIKKADNDSKESYIYKKVSSSVKDIEERIAVIEKQIAANKKLLGDKVPIDEEEKEEEKKSSSNKKTSEEPKSTTKSTSNSSGSSSSEAKKKTSSTKEGSSTPSKNELTKDASASSIVSAASTIEATAENVAKLPKIPKVSAKKPVESASSDATTDESKKDAKSATSKSNKTETSSKTETSKTTKSETKESSSSSSKDKDAKSSSSSSNRYGPITEDEIDQVLPYFQWCSMCKNFFESTDEFISHLHRDTHLNGLRTSDFNIIKRAEEKMDAQLAKEEKAKPSVEKTDSTLNGTNEAASNDKSANDALNKCAYDSLGTEFLYPHRSTYCDLCAKFLFTTQQAEAHLHSEKHLTLYKKYLAKNKDYDAKMASSRKSNFRYSYLMRTLIRMKEKGEDIVAHVSQEKIRRERAKEREREEAKRKHEKEDSSSGTKRRKAEHTATPSGSGGSGDIETLVTDLVEQTDKQNQTLVETDKPADGGDNSEATTEITVKKEEESSETCLQQESINSSETKTNNDDERNGVVKKEEEENQSVKNEEDGSQDSADSKMVDLPKDDDESTVDTVIDENENGGNNTNEEEEEYEEVKNEPMAVDEASSEAPEPTTTAEQLKEDQPMEETTTSTTTVGRRTTRAAAKKQQNAKAKKANGNGNAQEPMEEDGFDVLDEA